MVYLTKRLSRMLILTATITVRAVHLCGHVQNDAQSG